MRSWDDVINGRRGIEPALAAALDEIGATVSVDDVLSCWFDADFVPFDDAIDLVRRAAADGWCVVLATNQEHRRAAYLGERLGALVPLDDVIYSADLGVQKHDARFFELASQRCGVDPLHRSWIVFVDDVEANVDQARCAGWTSFHAAPGAGWIGEVDVALGL
jgi:putative hydrolase of the HAD superfamily